MHTRTWWRFSTMRRERFKDVLRKNVDTFDKDYIEAIQKRRAAALSIGWKLIAVQLPILTFLVLSLIPIQASVSIFGVSPGASKNLREVLVVISALLGVCSSALNHHVENLNEVVAAYIERRSKGDKEVADYLGMALGTNYWLLPGVKYESASVGWGFLALIGAIALIAVTVVFATLFAAGYVHYRILRDIYADPSFSLHASILVVGFVLLCDCFSVLLSFLSSGGMPLQDLTNMLTITKIGERDPEKASTIYRAIADEHLRRPWIIRIFFRIKMPKKLPPV